MKAVLAALAILTLVAAYAAGRQSRGVVEMDLSALESFRESLDEDNALIRSLQFNGFLETLSPDNLDEVLAIVEARQDWFSKSEMRNFLLAWARFNPRGALDWALSRPLRYRNSTAAAAMYASAFYDNAEARKALIELDETEGADRLVFLKEHFAVGWMRSEDRNRVVDYLASQRASNFRQKATSKLAGELLGEGPEVMIQWVEAIPGNARDNYKAVAFQKAANTLAQVDPVHASRWIEGHLDRAYSKSTPSVIAKRWSDRGDSPAALEWLASLPAGEVRDQAVRSTIQQWEAREPEIARNWLRLATPAEALDLAVKLIVQNDFKMAPDSALEWAERIHDPTERRNLIVRTGQQWFRKNPEFAREWLESSGLAEDIQTEIQQAPRAPTQRSDLRQAPIDQSGFEAIRGAVGVGEA